MTDDGDKGCFEYTTFHVSLMAVEEATLVKVAQVSCLSTLQLTVSRDLAG